MEELADRLAATSASAAIVDNFWVVPTVQTIHIIAIAFILTASVVLTARAWNLVGVEWTPARWGRRLLPGLWIGLAVQLVTGAVMIVGEPGRELPNPMFQLKLLLLLVAVPVAALLARRVRSLDGDQADAATRLIGAVLVLLWLAIIAAGRWIAYS